MKALLCALCKGRGFCGKPCPILQRMKYWKQTIEQAKDFFGTSPPSIFCGRWNYPKIWVGILAPPYPREDASILDSPEEWYKKKIGIDEILSYRGCLIYSRFRSHVRKVEELAELTQELAMSKSPIDVEVRLKKKPKFTFRFGSRITPIGNPALILSARLAENPKIERKVDRVTSDYDLKAEKAVVELYHHKIELSKIQKILAAGLLGLKIQRRFVPTRWSITAVDSIVAKALLKKIKGYQELGEIRLFHSEYIGNHYEILFLPGAYQYELIETKHPKSVWNPFGKEPAIYADYEPYWGRKIYASNTGGAFYAGRIVVLEYLGRIKRQASVVIVREVRKEYFAPVGIWQMRECIRGAFFKKPERFTRLEEAIQKLSRRLIIGNAWLKHSKLLKFYLSQARIKEFVRKAS
jgi:hypothetical protein